MMIIIIITIITLMITILIKHGHHNNREIVHLELVRSCLMHRELTDCSLAQRCFKVYGPQGGYAAEVLRFEMWLQVLFRVCVKGLEGICTDWRG